MNDLVGAINLTLVLTIALLIHRRLAPRALLLAGLVMFGLLVNSGEQGRIDEMLEVRDTVLARFAAAPPIMQGQVAQVQSEPVHFEQIQAENLQSELVRFGRGGESEPEPVVQPAFEIRSLIARLEDAARGAE